MTNSLMKQLETMEKNIDAKAAKGEITIIGSSADEGCFPYLYSVGLSVVTGAELIIIGFNYDQAQAIINSLNKPKHHNFITDGYEFTLEEFTEPDTNEACKFKLVEVVKPTLGSNEVFITPFASHFEIRNEIPHKLYQIILADLEGGPFEEGEFSDKKQVFLERVKQGEV